MRLPDSSWETYMQVKKHQLEPDMEQQTGSKSGKEYLKAVWMWEMRKEKINNT